MRRAFAVLAIAVIVAACSHEREVTPPDHCETEMGKLRVDKGDPTFIDSTTTSQLWRYLYQTHPEYLVLFDWSSGTCVVSYP